MTKVCNKCKAEQPEANFSKGCNASDGLQHTCKDCNMAYRKAHQKQINAHNKQYLATHRAENIERTKQYYAGHKEERREYRQQHKEQIIEHGKKYYAEHKEKFGKLHAAYMVLHKDMMHRKAKEWRENNNDVMKAYCQSRRAKKAGIVSTLTPVQWENIINEFNNVCAYCGSNDKTLHQEHFIPLSGGGEYTHNNIIPSCKSCNSSKGTKDFFAWYPKCDFYNKAREKKIMKFLHYAGTSQQISLWAVKGGQ